MMGWLLAGALAAWAWSQASRSSRPGMAGELDGVPWRITAVDGGYAGWVWSPEDDAYALLDEAQGALVHVARTLASFIAWFTGASTQSSVGTLQVLLEAAGVRNFRATELLRIHHPQIARDVGIDTPWFEASDDVLAQLVETAKLAEEIRREYGGPIRIINGFRPDAYNDRVSEASESQHEDGRALDMSADDMPRLRDVTRRMYKRGRIKGLRIYSGNVVHVDTRPGAPHYYDATEAAA